MSSWKVPMSTHAGLVVNPIRTISDNAKVSPSPKPIIKLSVGDPTLDKNLLTPQSHIKKLNEVANSQDWNGYLPVAGAPEAREAIATWWRDTFVHNKHLKSSIVKDNVVVCSGGSHGILMAITAVCDAGDYVLVPKPGFPHYETVCKAYGIGMHFYTCRADKDWEADLDEIRRLKDDKTKLIVMTNPSNPCGSNFRRKHVEELVRLAEELHLPMFADEIYAGMVFKGKDPNATFTSVADFDSTVPRVILGGTAKNLVVPGWRLGWLLYVDPHGTGRGFLEGLKRVSMLVCGPNTLTQGAVAEALLHTPQEYFDGNVRMIEESAMYLYEHLAHCFGVVPTMPQGAMYIFSKIELEKFKDIKTDVEFFEKLLEEENVQVLPGSIFNLPGFMRVTTTRPVSVYREAVERIKAFCQRHAA
ncbi:tyrosine aminotransferase [Trypanosoma conorhini]|uniref:Tyrosine aminotransferase n=1 Tax=Trypanosoma conorhini TaxID=83891 RepID=A0A422MSL4_9TRYP|nr:tyrosine aminotransferase [Trypanosoma conorhini]RNE96177.1 tyrosine aminotransferase [Trypanosoma conorhini]